MQCVHTHGQQRPAGGQTLLTVCAEIELEGLVQPLYLYREVNSVGNILISCIYTHVQAVGSVVTLFVLCIYIYTGNKIV